MFFFGAFEWYSYDECIGRWAFCSRLESTPHNSVMSKQNSCNIVPIDSQYFQNYYHCGQSSLFCRYSQLDGNHDQRRRLISSPLSFPLFHSGSAPSQLKITRIFHYIYSFLHHFSLSSYFSSRRAKIIGK